MPVFFKKVPANSIKEGYPAHLIGLYEEDQDVINKLSNEKPSKAKGFSTPRNPGHHRKMFLLFNIVLSNLPEDQWWESHGILFSTMNPESAINRLGGDIAGQAVFLLSTKDILRFVKFQQGEYERINLGEGQVALELNSISFESMPQHKFNEFYEKTVNIILKYLLPPQMPGADAMSKHRQMLEEQIALEF